MAMTNTQDPYFRHSVITHDGATTADAGVPVGAQIFLNRLGCNVIKIRAVLSTGTATIRLKEYSGRLSDELSTETWLNGDKYDIASGTTTLTPSFKFDTTGSIVAVYLEAIAGGGNITIEAVLADSQVAGN